MQDFRKLAVWRKAHAVTLDAYRSTERLPTAERFGLSRQIRRSAVSVAANIAEGAARSSQRDFKRFLGMALGSASELEYHLLLAYDLGMLGAEEHARLSDGVEQCKRMLTALIARIASDGRAAK